MLRFLDGLPVAQKRVLVRLDLDLPPKGKSFDDTRLVDGLTTIKYLLDKNAEHITIIAHLGRPEGKKVAKLSLSPIEVLFRKHFSAEENKRISIQENLRFHPGEEKNDATFAKQLAKNQDLFVNDAFATSHRSHASIVGVPKYVPSVLGFQFRKELDALQKVTKKARRPFVAIVGGSKLSTKLQFLERLQDKADVILVGGKMAVELKVHPVKLRKTVIAELEEHGKDINQATADQFGRFIAMAKTILWNGPMGVYEDRAFRKGTQAVAEAFSRSTGFTVAGGGDTEAALDILGLTKKVGFISSGGGALLEYVSGGTLVGITAVEQSPV